MTRYLIKINIFLLALTLISCNGSSETESTLPMMLEVSDELKQQYGTDNNLIKIYSRAGHPATYRAITTAEIYGFKPSLIEISSLDDLEKNLPSDIALDVKSNKINLPLIGLGNGKIISAELFYEATKQLQVDSFQPNNDDQDVILYGILNCGYTDRAKYALNSHKIQYKFIDINSNAAKYMGEIAAKIYATDNATEWKAPCVETNNKMWCDGSRGFENYLLSLD
jgi:glutaredoxin